jgi:hypothetical protein
MIVVRRMIEVVRRMIVVCGMIEVVRRMIAENHTSRPFSL